MRCKNHPARDAKHFCTSCGIPLCGDCAEEARPGSFYCFQCAMLTSVTQVGDTLLIRKEKASEKKLKEKKKRGPFYYFVFVSCALILVMWGVVIFGGRKAPEGAKSLAGNERALLFMVDASIKRYARFEGNRYPQKLADLAPKYLGLREGDMGLLDNLSYRVDPREGYLLSLAKPKSGQLNVVLSAKGIKY